jgi:GrpB-like predicted nucleotidyltransferase (UPF0157 family)
VAAGAIVVVPYDPDWPRRFEHERERLADALAPFLDGGVHHVGSTAVPGLAAKPIIDMIAGVRDLDEARAAVDPLQRLGYVDDPHRPVLARHFTKPSLVWSERTHSLHLTQRGSDLWRERLTFRDALRADAALAGRYEALKLQLADEESLLDAYTRRKRAFVAEVLRSAGLTLDPS